MFRFSRWRRACAALLLVLAAAPALALTIGSKNFTEQSLLSSLTAQYLVAQGYPVSQKTDLATVLMRTALENRQLDLVWDYTGTALLVYHHVDAPSHAQAAWQQAHDLDAPKGLVWLNPARMNNTYAFAMQRQAAEARGIRSLSEMVRAMQADEAVGNKPWQFGFDPEFAGRSDGLKPMQAHYGFTLTRPQVRQMDAGLVYNAIRDGFVPVGLVYTTDGRIKGFDLTVLDDDRHYFPSYSATPVVRAEVLAANPRLAEQLNALSALLSNDAISAMNAQVDIEHKPVAEVARAFLAAHGLI
jgi:osmoprotectant transport system substrate-binding protein